MTFQHSIDGQAAYFVVLESGLYKMYQCLVFLQLKPSYLIMARSRRESQEEIAVCFVALSWGQNSEYGR